METTAAFRNLNLETTAEPIDAVRPHPRNPRRGDLDAVVASIATHGFIGAIIAQRSTGHILAGNHRLRAAIAAGAHTIPTIYLDVDDTTATKILLADNRVSDQAGYETADLASILEEIHATTGTLEGTAFDDDDLANLLDQAADPDWSGALGSLPDGDREPYRQMSFSLDTAQAALVHEAIAAATPHLTPDDQRSEDPNANALAHIAGAVTA